MVSIWYFRGMRVYQILLFCFCYHSWWPVSSLAQPITSCGKVLRIQSIRGVIIPFSFNDRNEFFCSSLCLRFTLMCSLTGKSNPEPLYFEKAVLGGRTDTKENTTIPYVVEESRKKEDNAEKRGHSRGRWQNAK